MNCFTGTGDILACTEMELSFGFDASDVSSLRDLLSFLNYGLGIEWPASSDLAGRLKAIVRPKARTSKTIGRFREYGTAQFDPDDVAFAAELGFDTK